MAVRYAWATSPMCNLKVEGKPWAPLASFRTDKWDWPESENFEETLVDRARNKEMNNEAAQRCQYRKQQEAARATEILTRVEPLGRSERDQ